MVFFGRGIRQVSLLVGLAAIASCSASVEPPLTSEQRAGYRIERVEVDIDPSARIWWTEAKFDIAEAAGIDTESIDAVDAYNGSDAGRAAMFAKIQPRIQKPIEAVATTALTGDRPAQLSVLMTNLILPDAGERIFIGGNFIMKGVVQVFDIESGAPLTNPQRLGAEAIGLDGLGGTLIEQFDDEPIDQTAAAFGDKAREWLQSTEEIDIGLPPEEDTPAQQLKGPSGV